MDANVSDPLPEQSEIRALARQRSRHIAISLTIGITAIAFVALLFIGLRFDQSKVPSAIVDKPANAFRVAWLQGQEHVASASESHFRLKDFVGKPLVLNFWASWCVSCRREAHELELFWREHKDAGVKVVGIAIQDEVEAAQAFARQFGKTYILGLDEDGKAGIDYGVAGAPETFLIDKDGTIRHKIVGPVTAQELRRLLPKIL